MPYCRTCGTLLETDDRCSKCNAADGEISAELSPRVLRKAIGLILLFVTLFLTLGSVHIISGRGIGLTVAGRESFGFREMFVDADTITTMPFLAAMFKYPLGIRALQREGYIPSAEEIERLRSEEIAAMMRKNKEAMDAMVKQSLEDTAELMRAFEAEQLKAMEDYEKAMRDSSTD